MALSHHIVKLLHGQRGAVAILFALCLIVLLGFAALAVDLARINMIKVELQNAADAAAIGGARSLSDASLIATDQPYNWTAARQMANQVATANYANGNKITQVTIDDGYWNILTQSFVQISYPYAGSPIAGSVPAIRATITIASGQNNGPLQLFFAPILGIAQSDVQASAIAVIAPPGSGTGLFPMAINSAMFNLYWDSGTNKPKLDPSTGKPYVIDIVSIYGADDDITSGEWTSLLHDSNNVPTIRTLLDNVNTSNGDNVKVGDSIWIQSGAKATLFDSVPTNIDVALAVVDNVETHSQQTVVAIAGFHIGSSIKHGNKSYVEGWFINNANVGTTNPGTGNGTPYGAYTPPMLVQ